MAQTSRSRWHRRLTPWVVCAYSATASCSNLVAITLSAARPSVSRAPRRKPAIHSPPTIAINNQRHPNTFPNQEELGIDPGNVKISEIDQAKTLIAARPFEAVCS